MNNQNLYKNTIIWDKHNLFEGRSPIMFRGRHEKGMYYFFQVLFKAFFLIYYLAGVISLWLCSLFVCQKKSYKIYRSFKRSYIETYFTIIKIRFKFRCLFSFLIYSKLSNMFRILATDALQFFRPMKQNSDAIRISLGHEMKVRRKQASWLAHVFRAIMYPQCPC